MLLLTLRRGPCGPDVVARRSRTRCSEYVCRLDRAWPASGSSSASWHSSARTPLSWAPVVTGTSRPHARPSPGQTRRPSVLDTLKWKWAAGNRMTRYPLHVMPGVLKFFNPEEPPV